MTRLLPTAYVVRDGQFYFHFVCQSTPRGVPRPGPTGGGYPHPALDGGGVPQPGPDEGGGTPARSRQGEYPGIPPPLGQGWGTLGIGQQMEYLIHRGRYASCVHSGGLSCLIVFSKVRCYNWN